MVKCKNCGHELEFENHEGKTIIRHKKYQYHEGDGGHYEYCSEKVVDCDKCKREYQCRCNRPEPKGEIE